jgi:hypothetical protein
MSVVTFNIIKTDGTVVVDTQHIFLVSYSERFYVLVLIGEGLEYEVSEKDWHRISDVMQGRAAG